MQRIADASKRTAGGGGGGGRMPLGRGDARSGYSGNQTMPAPQSNSVGMDDIRRLGRAGPRQPSSQGPASFGPPSMFAARGSNTRKSTLGVLGRGGEDSGTSSRTGTPPAAGQKKEESQSTSGTNAFR